MASADFDLDAHLGDADYQRLSHMARERVYSEEWRASVTELQAANPDAVEPAVDFLDADPKCLPSGYTKETLRQYHTRMDLSDAGRVRLAPIVTRPLADSHRPERERRRWLRLAESLGLPSGGTVT